MGGGNAIVENPWKAHVAWAPDVSEKEREGERERVGGTGRGREERKRKRERVSVVLFFTLIFYAD